MSREGILALAWPWHSWGIDSIHFSMSIVTNNDMSAGDISCKYLHLTLFPVFRLVYKHILQSLFNSDIWAHSRSVIIHHNSQEFLTMDHDSSVNTIPHAKISARENCCQKCKQLTAPWNHFTFLLRIFLLFNVLVTLLIFPAQVEHFPKSTFTKVINKSRILRRKSNASWCTFHFPLEDVKICP